MCAPTVKSSAVNHSNMGPVTWGISSPSSSSSPFFFPQGDVKHTPSPHADIVYQTITGTTWGSALSRQHCHWPAESSSSRAGQPPWPWWPRKRGEDLTTQPIQWIRRSPCVQRALSAVELKPNLSRHKMKPKNYIAVYAAHFTFWRRADHFYRQLSSTFNPQLWQILKSSLSSEKSMAMKPTPNNVSSLPMPTSRTVPVSSFKTKTAAQDPNFKTFNAVYYFTLQWPFN